MTIYANKQPQEVVIFPVADFLFCSCEVLVTLLDVSQAQIDTVVCFFRVKAKFLTQNKMNLISK